MKNVKRLRSALNLHLIAAAGVIVGLFGLGSVRAAGSTYYVSPGGSDNDPGTEAKPFRTIQRAADVVNPGDTVIVEDGTYTGTGVGTSCASDTRRPVVCVSRGGTSAAPVTFRARHPGGARLDGQANASTHGFYLQAAYLRIEGFEIFGLGNDTRGAAGILIYTGAHDIVIAHNDIHDIGKLCVDHPYGMSGIYIQNARVTIAGNQIHDIGRFAPGQEACRPRTTNYQNHDHGIYISGKNDGYAPGASDVRVSNNRVFNLRRGWPIQIYPEPVANLSILHNTFAVANPYRTGHILLAASTTNGRIINNVFDHPNAAALNFASGTHSNLVVSHNISSRAIANAAPGGVLFLNNLERIDPQLTSAGFQLQPHSPAVDRGVVLPEVPIDIGNRPRPQGNAPDIGADEIPTRR